MQHIHILGVCGTFMGSLAQLAKAKGFRVTGADTHVYPPMSDQLTAAGIELIEGYDPSQLALEPDVFVIGNVISRGNPLMEEILNRGLPYISGPQWLAENILQDRWVLAVAGTHGKTTTASMLAWILSDAGYAPGYLIGGVPKNFEFSAALGESDFFVIEADEYDSAFFDKRSKFVHYRSRTLVLNNLEYDHADIFPDLQAIQTQFHHLVRTVPAEGLIIWPLGDPPIKEVLDKGCWTPTQTLFGDWSLADEATDGGAFSVIFDGVTVGRVEWALSGRHNMSNALAAIAAARHVGVEPRTACEALSRFSGVKRRLELIADIAGVSIYDDFAHHPTAIKTTLEGLRQRFPESQITAVIEPRSNTMRMGVHQHQLAESCAQADKVVWYWPADQKWSIAESALASRTTEHVFKTDVKEIIELLIAAPQPGQQIVIMSNGGFAGIHSRLVDALKSKLL